MNIKFTENINGYTEWEHPCPNICKSEAACLLLQLQEYQNLLKDRGIKLKNVSIDQYALKRRDALRAIEILKRARIPIVGADLYFWDGKKIDLGYGFLSTDRRAQEDFDNYAQRSFDEAVNFINNTSKPKKKHCIKILYKGGFPERKVPVFNFVLYLSQKKGPNNLGQEIDVPPIFGAI